MAVPFLCCGIHGVTCAAGCGYWVAWGRGRGRWRWCRRTRRGGFGSGRGGLRRVRGSAMAGAPAGRARPGEGGGGRDPRSREGNGASGGGKGERGGGSTVGLGEDRHPHPAAWPPGGPPLAEADFVSDPVGVILARAVAIVCGLSRCDGIVEVDSLGICVVMQAGDKVRQDVLVNGVLVKGEVHLCRGLYV